MVGRARAARAIACGVLVAVSLSVSGCLALFTILRGRAAGNGEALTLGLWIFSPVVLLVVIAGIAAGLWLSHRLYRRALPRS